MSALAGLPTKMDLEGANNFRDLGGYPLADGFVFRSGKIYRSDHLAHLTDSDQQFLGDIGLKTVVDFRRRIEREENPDRIVDAAIQQLWLPVEAEGVDVISIRRRMEEGSVSEEDARNYLIDANESFVRNHRGVFSEFLHLLLDEANYPIVFHCSAGKDRAGFAAVLTLLSAGASHETVMHDYLATNHCNANYVNGILDGLSDNPKLNVAPEAIQTLMQVQPAFLQRAFDTISTDFGHVDQFLAQGLDFGPEKQQRVKALVRERL